MAFTKPNVNSVWANGGDIVSPAGAKVSQGWIAEIPAYEFENWIQNRQDQFNAHVNQYGIVVWDNSTEYQAGRSYVQGSDGVVYKAKQTHIGQNPTTDSLNTYWEKAFDTFGTAYTKSESDNLYLKKSNNLSDVASVASVRSNISVYSKSESDSRYLNEANNLSDLGNVATARSNLGVQSVAESDGKYLAKSSNLNDVQDKATARNNLSVYSKAQSDANYPNVSEFSSVKSTNGWQELPGGLIMQWGKVHQGDNSEIDYNLPTSFPNSFINVTVSLSTLRNGGSYVNTVAARPINNSQVRIKTEYGGGATAFKDIYYFAIGY